MHKGQITSIPQLTALTIARDERDGKLTGYASDALKAHYPQLTALTIARDERDGKLTGYASDALKAHYPQLTAARRATLLYRARKMLKKEGEE